ncbi:phosphate signaling complex protein PhoU [Peptoniphilus stercorisuis]|uniref:Phosphate-specific transport system accessory protein PhoU n=1 Tax=Peptoniphilus stercorisuis TaxID=1436965 RepID=A0ABS4KEJ6_9FIRM|nr:phosphate signaling complex protein PhoU [Peptoniphilus stercorisuis]MBP2026200.1 phosphate transport system protein [Peptoniphilus stercorisuis]
MRTRFDEELNLLNSEMLEMGVLIESAIKGAVDLLNNRDRQKAEKIFEYEEEIDKMELLIQNHCLRLLLEQQPVARDLRTISSTLKMITDMERIGDQCRDIAEITVNLPEGFKVKSMDHIIEMADATIKMVNDTLQSYVDRDIEKAEKIVRDDDIVDDYFIKVRDDLIEMIKNDTIDAAAIVDLMMIAKYLERIADHAVNISKWVIFSIRG